jgi:glycosyltransferase involved in cell wall biosynthesis
MTDRGTMAVATLGARMHYAVPRELHARGALSVFYTDLAFGSTLGALGSRFARGLGWKSLERLAGRSPGLPQGCVRSFPGFGLSYARRLRRATNDRERFEAYLWGGRRFCQKVVENWVAGSIAVYTCNTAGLEILEWLARRRIPAAVEQTIVPRLQWQHILLEADARFPGWSTGELSANVTDLHYAEREREEWALARTVLVGSDFGRDQIAQDGGPVDKVRVVPYGVSVAHVVGGARHKWHSRAPVTALFVGAVNLRKGAPVLSAAARKLAPGLAKFRLVGPLDLPCAAKTELGGVAELVGAVPGPRVSLEMSNADIFVFPSFCEGSATVCYEALAAGLPVVTTPNAGSVVRDTVDGFIVPAGDVEAFVAKVELLARDQDLRRAMSARARERALEFTTEKYGDRLVSALSPLLETS